MMTVFFYNNLTIFVAKEIELIVDEFKPPNFSELTTLDNWLHLNSNILKEGRLVHNRPEFGADDDEEKEMKKIEENDPFEAKLKPIS